jgi:hypothetical protein
VDVQITNWLHLCFITFKSAGEGEGWLGGNSTWLIYYKEKHKKNTDSHRVVLLNSFKCCVPVVFAYFLLLFSCLRRRRRWCKRGGDITFFFPNIAFYIFNYHKMNSLNSFIISKILVYILNCFLTNPWNSIEKGCHTNCVTFLAFWQLTSMNMFNVTFNNISVVSWRSVLAKHIYQSIYTTGWCITIMIIFIGNLII